MEGRRGIEGWEAKEGEERKGLDKGGGARREGWKGGKERGIQV